MPDKTSREDLEKQIGELVEEFGKLAGMVQDLTRDASGLAADELRDRTEAVARSAEDMARRVGASAQGELEAIEHYIVRKPFQSVLIAAFAGLVLGHLWRR